MKDKTPTSFWRVLDKRAIGDGPAPRSVTVDYGTEFRPRALEDWANRRGAQLDFMRSGKPTDNGHIESFNGRLRAVGNRENRSVRRSDSRRSLRPHQRVLQPNSQRRLRPASEAMGDAGGAAVNGTTTSARSRRPAAPRSDRYSPCRLLHTASIRLASTVPGVGTTGTSEFLSEIQAFSLTIVSPRYSSTASR
jgi:hypothetical protein